MKFVLTAVDPYTLDSPVISRCDEAYNGMIYGILSPFYLTYCDVLNTYSSPASFIYNPDSLFQSPHLLIRTIFHTLHLILDAGDTCECKDCTRVSVCLAELVSDDLKHESGYGVLGYISVSSVSGF